MSCGNSPERTLVAQTNYCGRDSDSSSDEVMVVAKSNGSILRGVVEWDVRISHFILKKGEAQQGNALTKNTRVWLFEVKNRRMVFSSSLG